MMKVGTNKVVSLTYTLRVGGDNGEILQEVTADRPFVYLFGPGGLLPAFQANLEGLGQGDNFSFMLTQDEAYGQASEENIVELDRKIFEMEGMPGEIMVQVGETVPMEDEDGHPLNGIVMEIKENTVIVDFNHPLAGMDLHFSGEILEVREPSAEELDHGHAHGPHHHHH